MECVVNLMEQFGRQYQISFDPAYNPKNRPRGKLDPCYMQIPCQRGTIYPWSEDRLAVDVDYRPITAKKLASLDDDVVLVQKGDHEKTFTFPLSLFDDVATIVKPRRRRQVSHENREKSRERMIAYRKANPHPEDSQRGPRDADTSP